MKTKNLKIVIALGIMLLAILAFNVNTVNAGSYGYVENGTVTEEIFEEVVPNSITLDMKEGNLEELEEKVFNEISKKFKEKGITVVQDDEYMGNKPSLGLHFELTNGAQYADILFVTYSDVNGGYYSKTISVDWTNKVEYNQQDKEYVENFLEELGFKKDNTTGHYVCNKLVYKELEDNSISETIKKIEDNEELSALVCGGDGGAAHYFRGNSNYEYKLFKNNVYYAHIEYYEEHQSQVTIPNTVADTDEAYIEYALPKIKEHLKVYEDYGISINNLKIEKISGYWYRVTGDNQEYLGDIILKKEDGAFLGNNIYADNLPEKADIIVTVKENEAMETEIKNKGYSKILGSYELTLKGIDKLESPVDITFNVGTEYNGKSIYVLHQKKNGTYENFEKTVTNGKITITVNELSPFVLGVKENVNSENNQENTTNTETINKGEKDETPKTGVENIIGYVILVTVVTGIGIVLAKKKLK